MLIIRPFSCSRMVISLRKGNIRLACLSVAFFPYPVPAFWEWGYLSKSSRCVCAVGFGSGTKRWCFFLVLPGPCTHVLSMCEPSPVSTPVPSSFASDGCSLLWFRTSASHSSGGGCCPYRVWALVHGSRWWGDPPVPCAHPTGTSCASLEVWPSLTNRKPQFPFSVEAAGISVLHRSNPVLWDTWKASKTDTCWLWSSQVLFPKYLWPLFLMFTLKKMQACVGCERKIKKEILSALTKIPCRFKRKMKVGTLRETRSPWDKQSRKQKDALYVWLLAKMSAVSVMERETDRNTYSRSSLILVPCKLGQYRFALPWAYSQTAARQRW